MPSLIDLLSTIQIGSALGWMAVLLSWESLHPLRRTLFPGWTDRGRHGGRNLALGALNSILISLVFVSLWAIAAGWADGAGFGLLHLVPGLAPTAAAVAAVLLLDAWTYAWHRMNHTLPLLWRFHRVHHADRAMDVTTASRFHLGEIAASSLLRIPLIVLFGVELWQLVLYETLMFAVVQFHHANLGLPPWLDRALRVVIVTPAMHQVHHSRWMPETNSNFGAFLSVWDRIGRTFRLNPSPESIQFGLDEFEDSEHEPISAMLRMPFRGPEDEQ